MNVDSSDFRFQVFLLKRKDGYEAAKTTSVVEKL